MVNLNIAVLGRPEYGNRLGKKGTSSDITLYNAKRGDHTLTLLEPVRYPERLSSLFYSVSLADYAILVVNAITPQFGETLLMLQAAGVRNGFVILHPHIDVELFHRIIKGTVVEQFRFLEDNPIALREILLEKAESQGPPPSMGPGQREACSIAVDHFFPVRGIGVVVLGRVIRGTVLHHDMLMVLPRGLSVQVRSIQKHDDDVPWAGTGDRVGLALKGITLEDLDRGDVLTNDTSLSTISTLTAEATINPYWKQPVKAGMVVHIGHWMQFIPSRLLSAEQTSAGSYNLTLALEKPLIHPPSSKAVLCFLDGKKLRVMGTIQLPLCRTIEEAPASY